MKVAPATEERGHESKELLEEQRRRQTLELLLILAAIVGCLAAWAVGAAAVDIADITDVGIVSALNAPLVIAPLVLIGLFLISLSREHPTWLLVLQTLALIFMLFGTGPIFEPVVSFHVSWRHAGVIDHIARGLGIDPTIDVYFNWPGFFIVSAWLSSALGTDNPIELARWAPVIYNIAYLLPVYVIGKQLSRNRFTLWLGVWIFFLGNWIGQDYFSPQGAAYFFYLVMLALALRYLVMEEASGPSGLRTGVRPLAAAIGIVVAYSLIVPTHQLTPILALFVFTTFAVKRLGVPAGLPIFMVVAISSWWTFMASDFLEGNLPELVEQIGRLDALAGANVQDRLSGSPGHVWVVRLRVLSALAMWGVAGYGWLRSRRADRTARFHRATTVVFLTPFLLLPLASYGGEMVLRVFLFTLPAAAFLAASAIESLSRRTTTRYVATTIILLALLFSFPITRYGNESTNLFTPAEVALVDALYDIAPDGSTIISPVDNSPWKYREYDIHKHIVLERLEPLPDAAALSGIIASEAADRAPGTTFVLINRVQYHHLEVFGIWPAGSFEVMTDELIDSGAMQIAFQNEEGIVLRSSAE